MIIADINGEDARRVAAAITRDGGQAEAAAIDVTREQDVRHLIEDAASRYGRLDYLFNNAGVGLGGDAWKALIWGQGQLCCPGLVRTNIYQNAEVVNMNLPAAYRGKSSPAHPPR